MVDVAVGSVCFVCGTAAGTWPLMSYEELLQRKGEDRKFAEEFKRVCQCIVDVKESLMAGRVKSVLHTSAIGMKFKRKFAFVALDKFLLHFKGPVAEGNADGVKNVKVVQLRGIEAMPVKGVLMDPATIPPSALKGSSDGTIKPLRYDTVSVYHYSDRMIDDVYCDVNTSWRQGQAEDSFKKMCTSVAGSRCAEMRGPYMAAFAYGDVQKEAQE